MFESSVILWGSKTEYIMGANTTLFESSVILWGSKTTNSGVFAIFGLRVV